jgi:hypothetical protein
MKNDQTIVPQESGAKDAPYHRSLQEFTDKVTIDATPRAAQAPLPPIIRRPRPLRGRPCISNPCYLLESQAIEEVSTSQACRRAILNRRKCPEQRKSGHLSVLPECVALAAAAALARRKEKERFHASIGVPGNRLCA